MDWQNFINLGLGGLLSLVGWFARQLWDAVKTLQAEMSKLELAVSDNYVKKTDMAAFKSEMSQRFDKIEHLIDRVYSRLDNKADK